MKGPGSSAGSLRRLEPSMKAQEGVINILNKVLTVKLMAINQHFVHAKMCEHWGYERRKKTVSGTVNSSRHPTGPLCSACSRCSVVQTMTRESNGSRYSIHV